MKTLIESLKLYFGKNSESQILNDWNEFEEFDKIGPKIDDFLHQSNLFYEIEIASSYWEFNNFDILTENPKFTSDFLF